MILRTDIASLRLQARYWCTFMSILPLYIHRLTVGLFKKQTEYLTKIQ